MWDKPSLGKNPWMGCSKKCKNCPKNPGISSGEEALGAKQMWEFCPKNGVLCLLHTGNSQGRFDWKGMVGLSWSFALSQA